MAGRRVRGVRAGAAAAACLSLVLAGTPARGTGGTGVDPATPVAAAVLVPLVGGALPPGEAAGTAGTGAGAGGPTASGAATDPTTPGATDGPSAGTPRVGPDPTGAAEAGSGESAAASESAAATPAPSGSAVGGVARVGVGVGSPLDPDRVADAVGPLLRGGALGSGRTPTSVVDVASGEILYAARPGASVTPASTVKLVTAASVLTSLGPDAVLRTRTVILDPAAGTPRVVLVGAGDPSLAATPGPVGAPGTTIEPAALSDLAAATARALAARGIAIARVGYDDSAFTGPDRHPTWAASFPAAGIVAPVSALQVDQGRSTTGISRVAQPAESAARLFAEQLEAAGIEVTGRLRQVEERAGSIPLASVSSPPVSRLVERMVATSDNDYAEALARLGAAAAGHPATFAGVAGRGAQVLAGLGIGAPGDTVADGSGLSRANALAPATLTDLLRLTTPQLGPTGSGMPIGGTTGSLRARYRSDATEPARGLVRAKTGTLTGVVGLAGYVSRPDGRLLAFAVLDDSVPGGALAGRAAIDRALAALVTCDCAVR